MQHENLLELLNEPSLWQGVRSTSWNITAAMGMGILRNTTFWILTLIALALFVPAALFMPRQGLFEVLNAVCVAASIGVVAGYGATAWKALRMPPHDMTASHLQVVGIVLAAIAIAGVFIGQSVWRGLGKADWILDSSEIVFTRWLLAMGLLLMLTTNWSEDGELIQGAYERTAALLALTVLIAGLVLALV